MKQEVKDAIEILKRAFYEREIESLPVYEGREWPGKHLGFDGLIEEIEYKINHKDVDISHNTGNIKF